MLFASQPLYTLVSSGHDAVPTSVQLSDQMFENLVGAHTLLV